MPWEFFTFQADFHGTVYNATQLSSIPNNDGVQNLEFFVTPLENITVCMCNHYHENLKVNSCFYSIKVVSYIMFVNECI